MQNQFPLKLPFSSFIELFIHFLNKQISNMEISDFSEISRLGQTNAGSSGQFRYAVQRMGHFSSRPQLAPIWQPNFGKSNYYPVVCGASDLDSHYTVFDSNRSKTLRRNDQRSVKTSFLWHFHGPPCIFRSKRSRNSITCRCRNNCLEFDGILFTPMGFPYGTFRVLETYDLCTFCHTRTSS